MRLGAIRGFGRRLGTGQLALGQRDVAHHADDAAVGRPALEHMDHAAVLQLELERAAAAAMVCPAHLAPGFSRASRRRDRPRTGVDEGFERHADADHSFEPREHLEVARVPGDDTILGVAQEKAVRHRRERPVHVLLGPGELDPGAREPADLPVRRAARGEDHGDEGRGDGQHDVAVLPPFRERGVFRDARRNPQRPVQQRPHRDDRGLLVEPARQADGLAVERRRRQRRRQDAPSSASLAGTLASSCPLSRSRVTTSPGICTDWARIVVRIDTGTSATASTRR